MGFTQITSTNLSTDLSTQIAAGTAANNAVANIITLTVKTVQVADSSYNTRDDTAANTDGGYLVLTGTGFTPNCIVIVGQTNATSTSYVNTTCIRAQTQAFSAATYNIYVVDSYTGATAIKVNGYTTSSFPVWGTSSTLSNQLANTAFGVSLSANSDSSITYANTTALPAGTTLLANGYFYGTVSIGTQTTYSFTVDATDTENQDALRTFSLTVTITPQYSLWGIGFNGQGALLNNTVTRSSPVQVGTDTNWTIISIGRSYDSVFGIKNTGTLWAWGEVGSGNLGLNDAVARSSPTQIGSATNWSSVSSYDSNAIALKTDGTIWTWGRGNEGQLGLNNINTTSSPIQVGSSTNWSSIIAGNYTAHAIKTDGTLWSWGKNVDGSVGDNSATNRSSPVQIGAGTTWSKIRVGYGSTFAIKTDGTLWAWGSNSSGQLGLNDINSRSSPVQIGAGTTWSNVVGGSLASFTIATKTDGTLWGWGSSTNGNLGDNSGIWNYSSPVQIGALTNWSNAAAGNYWAAATKTDGTLWAWGKNDYGQLGQNNSIQRSSPTQVGSLTTWRGVQLGWQTAIFTVN